MIVKTEDILQVQMTRWLFGAKDPAGECVNSRTNLPFDPRLTGNIIALGNDNPSASLSKRTGFVNSDPQVRIFPWDVLKTIQEEVYSFTKLTGRLLLEVAVNKNQAEQYRDSARLPEAWSETPSHNHAPEQSHP